jgi:chromosome segregation ATPase
MTEITGIAEHEQSRLLQHKNSIDSFNAKIKQLEGEHETLSDIMQGLQKGSTYEGYTPEIVTERLEGIQTDIHFTKGQIEQEQTKLKEFVQQLTDENTNTDTVDEWIDLILETIDGVEKIIGFLPEDIRKPIQAVLDEFKRVLNYIKDLF